MAPELLALQVQIAELAGPFDVLHRRCTEAAEAAGLTDHDVAVQIGGAVEEVLAGYGVGAGTRGGRARPGVTHRRVVERLTVACLALE